MPIDKKPAATTRASLERIKRVCDRVEGRVATGQGQKRRRAIGVGGGKASAAPTEGVWARVTSTGGITAAKSEQPDKWGAGKIRVWRVGETGTNIYEPEADAVNFLPISFAKDDLVEVYSSGGVYRVKNGTCFPYPWSAPVP